MEGDYHGGSINYIQISRYTKYMSLAKIAITIMKESPSIPSILTKNTFPNLDEKQ